MRTLILSVLLLSSLTYTFAQERSVKIDFESGTFINSPNIPFDKPFVIQGELGKDIEFVKVNIGYADKDFDLHSFTWNRVEANTSASFNIVVPAILKSNTKYDFKVITYKGITEAQKRELHASIMERVRFLLVNNLYFDGKKVIVNKPKDVCNKIDQLIDESLAYYESKNSISNQAPSSLVLEELKKQDDFKFGRFMQKANRVQTDSIANVLIKEKVDHLMDLISSELAPYTNSQLVQHFRMANIQSIETDKEPFTLPINVGMYAWNKTTDINNISTDNVNFTPGLGITIPFRSKSKFTSRKRLFDSFGWSIGVLLDPVKDANEVEFVTPGVGLPIYNSLGFRMFKVVRINAGALVVAEKGNSGFDNLSVIPTVGLALELNLWLGIKK